MKRKPTTSSTPADSPKTPRRRSSDSRRLGADSRDAKKSKSQLKREFQERKKLGVELARLSAEQLSAMPLSADTHEALVAAQGMTRIARQRQHGHLASLLDREDLVAVRAALAGELQEHADEVAAQHEAQRWRDRLLSGDRDDLTAFVESHPGCDPTRLRQLVRNARRESELGKPPRSARLLFRALRDLSEVDP